MAFTRPLQVSRRLRRPIPSWPYRLNSGSSRAAARSNKVARLHPLSRGHFAHAPANSYSTRVGGAPHSRRHHTRPPRMSCSHRRAVRCCFWVRTQRRRPSTPRASNRRRRSGDVSRRCTPHRLRIAPCTPPPSRELGYTGPSRSAHRGATLVGYSKRAKPPFSPRRGLRNSMLRSIVQPDIMVTPCPDRLHTRCER